MADIIDQANDLAAIAADRQTNYIRHAAAQIPVGTAGDCDICGEWTGRLVGGHCAPCRDKHKLP